MKSKKVLIVDNNDLTRKLIESLIGQLCSFVSVKTSLKAVEQASAIKFDLILMDLQLPGSDGISTQKKIRRQSAFLCPIIAISTFSTDSTRECLLESGFDEVITKPIRPKELLDIISGKLTGKEEKNLEIAPQQEQEEVLNKKVLNQLLKYNTAKTIKSIYLDFLVEYDELMDKINPAFESKDQQSLIESLHTVKGNSGTLGCSAIFKLSSDADLHARAQDWKYLEEKLIKLKIERILLEKYIKEETTFIP